MTNNYKYLNMKDLELFAKELPQINQSFEYLSFDEFSIPFSQLVPHQDLKLLKKLYAKAISLEQLNLYEKALDLWDRFDALLSKYLQFEEITHCESLDELLPKFPFRLAPKDLSTLRILYDLALYCEKKHEILEAENLWEKITNLLAPYWQHHDETIAVC